jgi:hypothetical protein
MLKKEETVQLFEKFEKISDHFVDVSKTTQMHRSAEKEFNDILFTCYLTAQTLSAQSLPEHTENFVLPLRKIV